MPTSSAQPTAGAAAGPLQETHLMVWTSLFAGLMAVGAYLHFPLGPVPISLSVVFVLMAGFVLGPKRGLMAVLLYILAGLVGLPVFYGGNAGLGHVLGPTGGYIAGFLPAVLVTGLGKKWMVTGRYPMIGGTIFALMAYVCIYAAGLPWLKQVLEVSWGKAAALGMVPFLVSDVLQIALCVSAVRFLHKQGLVPQA